MRAIQRMFVTGCMLLGACLLSSHEGWAAGASNPAGEPPFGVAPQSNAKGTRLQGVFVIEFLNSDGDTAQDGARGILRLRKASLIESYSALVPGPLEYGTSCEQRDIQRQLINAMGPDVVEDFLAGEVFCILPPLDPIDCTQPPPADDTCANIKVKRLEEFVQVDTTDGSMDQFFLMDIELAVD